MLHATEKLSVLLLFLIAHLVLGALLMGRAGRRPLLWTVLAEASSEVSRRLNRETRSEQDRLVRGFIVVVLLACLAMLFGYVMEKLSGFPFGFAADLLLLAITVAGMTPIAVLRRVRHYLAEGKLRRANETVATHLTEDIGGADESGVIRKAVEYAAVNMNVLLVGPSLFFVAFGAAGLVLYIAVMAMHSAFGRADRKTFYFGGTVRALETLANWVPARVTALLFALAAGAVSKAHPLAAIKVAAAQARKCESPNRGWVIGAAAGALGITLGGPRHWKNGEKSKEDWIGAKESSAKVDGTVLKRAGLLCFAVYVTVMALAAIALGGFIRFT